MKELHYEPKVSVIVLNYNRIGETLDCIRSVQKSSYPNLELILVDNCSKRSSFDLLKRKVESLDVLLLRTDRNLGYAGGNNFGIRQSTGKYILVLNDDVTIPSELIEEIVRIAEEDSTIGVIGPVIYRYKTNEVWGYPQEISCSSEDVLDVPLVMGAALMIKREVIQKIGLLDENFFMYHEEWDWCIRAREAGYRIVCATRLKAWHKVPMLKDHLYTPHAAYFWNRNYFIIARKYRRGLGTTLGFLFKYLVYGGNRDFRFLFIPVALKNKKNKTLRPYLTGIIAGIVLFLKFNHAEIEPRI